MTATRQMAPRQAAVNAAMAYAGALVAQTGIQLIAPSLPVMRDALGLTDARLALVTSVYLLPAALAALPAGIAADRLGRRRVFGWSMLLLGVCGVGLQFATGSFGLFLAIRFIQGTAFAGMMPLTMTILGDAYSGAALIRAHGRRTVFMHLGDGLLPIIGGLVVAIGWQTPWLGQIVGIPFGFLVLAKMADPSSLDGGSERVRFGSFLTAFRTLPIVSLQVIGFLRMFLKFGIVTFIPLLLDDQRTMSPAFAGVVVGVAALTSALPAAVIGVTGGSGRPAGQVGIGVAGAGLGLLVMAHTTSTPLILAAALLYGITDGLSGVYVNAFVSSATDADQRASFVAATGAIRNFAKFLAPATIGALTLVAPLIVTFTTIGLITLAAAALWIPLRALEPRLADQRSTV